MPFIDKDPDAKSFNYTLDSSSAELAALVDKLYDETSLNRALVHKKGKQVFFNIDTLKTWRDSRAGGDLDYTQERAKLTRLQAAKATLELEQQRGNLIPLELVVVGWEGQIANCRAKFLALPSKVAAQAVGADYVEIEQLFKIVIYEALDELAGDGVPEEYQKRLEVITANLEASQN